MKVIYDKSKHKALLRARRGGSWAYVSTFGFKVSLQAANRGRFSPGYAGLNLGLRVMRKL